MRIADLYYALRADGSALAGDIEQQGAKAAASAGDKAGRTLGQSLAAGAQKHIDKAGAAVGAFVATGVELFGGFQQRMNEVFTLLPGITQTQMDKMTEDVKAFSRETGKLPDEVIPALYQAISAGVPPDNVFDFLRTANKGAVAGVAKTADEVNLLAAVTKGFGDTSAEATARAADTAQMMVKLGQTTIPELAASYGQAIPMAHALGVSNEELAAASASLFGVTGQTSEVMTQEKAVFAAMIQQNPYLTAGLKAMGYATSEQAIKALGLKGALDGLVGTTHGSSQALQQMLGSSEAVTAALALTGAQSQTFASNLTAIGHGAGTVDTAFEKMDSGVLASGRKLAATAATIAIDVGEKFQAIGPFLLALNQGGQLFGVSPAKLVGGAAGALAGQVAKRFLPSLVGAIGSPEVLDAAEEQGVAAAARYGAGFGDKIKALAPAAITVGVTLVVAKVLADAAQGQSDEQVAARRQFVLDNASTADMARLLEWQKELRLEQEMTRNSTEGVSGALSGMFGTLDAKRANLASVTQSLADVDAAIARLAAEGPRRGFAEGTGKVLGLIADQERTAAQETAQAGASLGDVMTRSLVDSVTRSRPSVASAVGDTVTGAMKSQASAVQAAADAGRAQIAALAQAVRDGKGQLQSAWSDAESAAVGAANAADQMIVNSAEMAAQRKILADKKATAAEKAQARIRLRELQQQNDQLLVEQTGYGTRSEQIAKTKALLTSKALLAGLKSKDPDVRQHWLDVKTAAEKQLDALKADAGGYGTGTTTSYADGLTSTDAMAALVHHLLLISGKVKALLKVSSPADEGPLSLGGGPEGWGDRFTRLYARGLAGPLPLVASTATMLAAAAVPGPHAGAGEMWAYAPEQSLALAGGPGGPSAAYAGGLTINVSTPVLTPGAADALARAIAPHITRWQRDRA